MVCARPPIRRGHRYPVEPPVPGASTVMVWTPRNAFSNGAHISRLPPMPMSNSNGRPVPRTETRNRTPSTSTSRRRLRERAHTGDVPSDDERLDRLGALVPVDGLDVGPV